MTSKEELIKLYAKKSKHSNYQILPRQLAGILSGGDVQTTTRYERERLAYILQRVDPANKTVLDIGANTGFFGFELLDAGAKSVHCYEGNKEHAEFASLAAGALGLGTRMRVTNDYFSFKGAHQEQYDIVLLLNVLHHVGDDYGCKDTSINEAKRLMIDQLNSLRAQAGTIVFQLGFNWQGDRTKPLFLHGTKREMIDFIAEGTRGVWRVAGKGIAERQDDNIMYSDLDDTNIERDDSLGEFLNRPIFILQSES